MSILNQIFADKKEEVALAMQVKPPAVLEKASMNCPVRPSFFDALRSRRTAMPAVIAEIKRRSPSKGPLNPGLDPAQMAETYISAGAAAISVLTDMKYFGGSLEDLEIVASVMAAKEAPLPLLRKEFIFSPYQVFEAKLAGASAVLLIVAMLEDPVLRELIDLVESLGLAALVEVHDRVEVDRALGVGAKIIGINNRNLHSFEVDLHTTVSLRPFIPPEIAVVSESGIRSVEDIKTVADAGVDGVLIGEALVTSTDPGGLLGALAGSG